MTVTTDVRPDVPDFTGLIEDAPEGYKPRRSPAGRTRIPSQFEGMLPGLKGKSWQRIPHDGKVKMVKTDTDRLIPDPESVKESSAHVIIRELRKAQQHLKLGMDLQITDEFVYFQIRDKQLRKPRGQGEEDTDVTSYDDDDEDLDSDED